MSRWMFPLENDEVLTPAGFGVLIEIPHVETKSKGGIITISDPDLEERERRGATRGIVTKIGPLAGRANGHKPEDWGLVIGNVVTFSRYEGNYYQRPDGTTYLMINDTDIDGVVTKQEE